MDIISSIYISKVTIILRLRNIVIADFYTNEIPKNRIEHINTIYLKLNTPMSLAELPLSALPIGTAKELCGDEKDGAGVSEFFHAKDDDVLRIVPVGNVTQLGLVVFNGSFPDLEYLNMNLVRVVGGSETPSDLYMDVSLSHMMSSYSGGIINCNNITREGLVSQTVVLEKAKKSKKKKTNANKAGKLSAVGRDLRSEAKPEMDEMDRVIFDALRVFDN